MPRPNPPYRVFMGWDADEMVPHVVAQHSLFRHATNRHQVQTWRISRLSLVDFYRRPTEVRDGRLWDVLSDAPMSTGHAIARFFVPFLCRYDGWALFTDGDTLFRDDVRQLFALADPRYAIQVVQHPPQLEEGTKKDGAVQQAYPRKNWSSVMLFNCAHPANVHRLTLDVLNTWPGRDLHRFAWLDDEDIGALPARWNHLVGVSAPDENPALVHYTLGTPDLPGHQHDAFADEWYDVAKVCGYSLPRPTREAVAS